MPELPEVETVRRTLAPALTGRRVSRAVLHRHDYCTRADGRPCTPADLLEGLTIAAVERRGKQLALLAGRTLVLHLGMTGQLLILGPGESPPNPTHLHATWELDSGSRLVFRDPRRFGGIWALPSEAVLRQRWSALGPDALAITARQLHDRAGASARAIKAALLDQAVAAGIGNIYADEALFFARINPLRPAHSLRPEEWRTLATAIRRTLNSAIDAGGSTLRDYVSALGAPGRAQTTHAVYARASEQCLACGGRLRGLRLVQRATVYCPSCQPRKRPRTVKPP